MLYRGVSMLSKTKTVAVIIIAALFVSSCAKEVIAPWDKIWEFKKNGKKVVVDAGHGGFDPGTVGRYTGVLEDGLNLEVSFALQEELECRGYEVVMTRTDSNALAHTKKADMEKRKEIIASCGADIGISIHMNASHASYVNGPVAIHYTKSEQGKLLASCVQKAMNEQLKPESPKNFNRSESLFILKAAPIPIIIVECGFLSNPREEKLLQDKNYIKRIGKSIADGIDDYFNITEP